jgi:hypothetical protein
MKLNAAVGMLKFEAKQHTRLAQVSNLELCASFQRQEADPDQICVLDGYDT